MSDEEIKALKVKRANAKRSLTSYENFFKKFDNSRDFPALEKRFNDIDKIREAFEAAQGELESLLEESEELQNYRIEFEKQARMLYLWRRQISTDSYRNRRNKTFLTNKKFRYLA
ncbi:hypothetical protein PV328_012160 [Microctonus aethiopoides]|uniref:Uncharacterized protein n=1 Tax=Microctonus aethiopoides TaxID=144406 RepID=A0AA39EXG1_9HYME|nr:hypothetical protein PV328_012160 [Microctonus aethiopoides]